METKDFKIGVLGLGYVGLPVALSMGKKFETVGFDIQKQRVDDLKKGYDKNEEYSSKELDINGLLYTDQIEDLKQCNFIIVAVPTPIDHANQPDLSPLVDASKLVSKVLKKGDIVVFESTVYPGATEEVCVPVLESESGLSNITDFKVGYSPERINPGDTEHTFEKILKITSGQDADSSKKIDFVYGSVVKAGIFSAANIKTAETAKVIENTQRDLNIALINEIAMICEKAGIDTLDVLEAAGTKWNFLPFRPGLVGGHCIGVDPYYLTHKAEELGYIPQVILAGRRVNNDMGRFVANKTIKMMVQSELSLKNSKITVLGLTFKENCKDTRNSKTFDVIDELIDYQIDLQISDPLIEKTDISKKYQPYFKKYNELDSSGAVIVCVAHSYFKNHLGEEIKKLIPSQGVIVDVKGFLERKEIESLGHRYWRL